MFLEKREVVGTENKIKDMINAKEALSFLTKIREGDTEESIEFTSKLLSKLRKTNKKENYKINYTLVNNKNNLKKEFKVKVVYSPFDKDAPTLVQVLKDGKDKLRTLVRSERDKTRTPFVHISNCQDAEGTTHTIRRTGIQTAPWTAVFTEPNTFINILKYKKAKDIFKAKVPTTKDNHLGIELEFYCDYDAQKLAIEFYDAGLTKYLLLKTDGSIRPEQNKIAHELNILVKESEYEEVITKVYEVLKKAGSKVNKTCGMHVHLDMRNRKKEIAFSNLVAAQDFLYAMNPSSRGDRGEGGRQYAKKMNTRKFSTTADRYHGINCRAFEKFQTLEIRIHSGILEARKIINWVKLLVCIVSKEKETIFVPRTLKGMVNKFALPKEVVEYMKERIQLFDNGAKDIEEVA